MLICTLSTPRHSTGECSVQAEHKRSTRKPMAVSHKIEEVLVALRRVIRATDLHSRRLVKIANVTGPQLLLLQTLANNGDITISELARDMSLSQATVTKIGRAHV